MASPLCNMDQRTNDLQSYNSPYDLLNNKKSSNQSLNSPNLGHTSKSTDHMNTLPQHIQCQTINPNHRMLYTSDSLPSHFNPHHPGNLTPPYSHPHTYQIMPPHNSIDPNGMMIPHPSGPICSSKFLPSSLASADPIQQNLQHLSLLSYVKMYNMDPLSAPSPGHQLQHKYFPSMLNDNFGIRSSYYDSHIHPSHHQMHLNDGRLSPQSNNNTYVSATMPIEQLNIQNLAPGGSSNELQPDRIYYHTSSPNMSYSLQQQFPSNHPQFFSQFNDLQALPSNLNVDGTQPLPCC